MAVMTNTTVGAGNGWHEMRTAERRTCLTQGGVVPGVGKGDSVGVRRHDAGAQRVIRWLEAEQCWSLTQFEGKHIAGHICHAGTLAEAERVLLSVL